MMDVRQLASLDGFSCLAIETSQPGCSVAATAGGRVATRDFAAPGEQSRRVYECVREVLDELGQTLAALNCIAFGCGPGGFTGLRIGAAVSQSLAYGAGLPVCRISSLAVLAAGAVRESGADVVAACLDARMGEAYVGIYARDVDTGLRMLLADRLVAPASFVLPDGIVALAAGGGWAVFPELLENNAGAVIDTDTARLPGAGALLELAAIEFRAGRVVSPEEALPNYIRDKVTS
ncbi:MAG: tRNA (adenosine(37)-N6)-threonylcarbamoyltransferase complex dimerization subunit type 1 TsaB [Gammaproteobacteria bacterium]|nr:MAG: tRNA (adenosine(37)-N6)-threonylcarbamoyltransferase complex dimerization subunit type 1 TsaB [Gammaproteobacteria bacterium]